MKLIVKNDKGEDISIRKVRDIEEFTSIFSNTTHVQEVSVNSVSAFILSITLRHDATPFRSDIFNERDELMNADEYRLPNTGRPVTQHILKCCIIQPRPEPRIADFNPGRNKITCTSRQFFNEYNDQSDIYDATMAYGGMPVCPDVYAVMEFNLQQFSETFFSDTLPPGHVRSLPAIGTNLYKDNRVFRYLLAQLKAPLPSNFERKVGIILMESLPESYEPLMKLHATFPASSSAISGNAIFSERKKLFDDMAYRSLSICVIVFYRIGYIFLDAHLENWMYDKTQTVTVTQFKVQAIDFGRILSRKLAHSIDTIRDTIRSYIGMYTNPSEKALIISGLARLLGIDPSTVDTAEICGTKVGEIVIALNKLIRRNQNGSILWNPAGPIFSVVTRPARAGSPEQTMEVDSCMILIHRIIFIIALIDGCFNACMFSNHHFCQLRDLFSSLFGTKCNNLYSMIQENVYIDFVSYLKAIPTDRERIRTIEAYRIIRDNIGEYLRVSPERGLFPDPFYQEPSPDIPIPEDMGASPRARAAILSPPPLTQPRSPKKSPSNLSPKKTHVSSLKTSHGGGGGGGGTKKLIKSMKKRKLKKSRKPIKTKLVKMLKTKKNKNHNRVRRNRRYRR
jgi:hypothetical protein